MDGSLEPARHPHHPRREGAGQVPGRRGAGDLPPAGRAHQRQAHRGDRPPDAAPRPHQGGRATPSSWSAIRSRSGASRRRTSACSAKSGRAGDRRAAAARHHQGEPLDRELHLGRVLPGDDQGAHRGRDQRQGRSPGRPQGERHHGPPDPGGHRRRAVLARWRSVADEPEAAGGRPRADAESAPEAVA